ncbi:HNH endonuclease signature motif containing protein [Leucobacter aridicollis]|uniref:HNH endonuclease signature motif containing protein n=1 Tax=Leucobacter aridicollis TaxID=283878 RepID=UPI0031DAC94E
MQSNGRFSKLQLVEIENAISSIEKQETKKRRLEAEQLAALASALQRVFGRGRPRPESADRELAYRSLRLEVATALNDSEHNAERLLSVAYLSRECFATSLEALHAGHISSGHLRVIIDEGSPLSASEDTDEAERRRCYEREVITFAREETPNRLRPIARRIAAAYSQETLAERHEAALKRRCIRIVALDDGMADLIAHLPAEDAYAIKDRVAAIAKRTITVSGGAMVPSFGKQSPAPTTDVAASGVAPAHEAPNVDRRSRDEVRADVFRDLLLGRTFDPALVDVDADADADADAGSGSGAEAGAGADAGTKRGNNPHEWDQVRAHVQVVIPAHGVPELVGYGPIDTATAAGLAAGARAWERVSVDDAGRVIAVDRYRPSAEMTRLLIARDLHCRAPGCRVPAIRCDVDHTVDAALGGPTSTTNLAHLCRGHHTVKHHTDWEVTQEPGGVVKWTSPTGREYRDKPPSRVRFRRTSDEPTARGKRAESGSTATQGTPVSHHDEF